MCLINTLKNGITEQPHAVSSIENPSTEMTQIPYKIPSDVKNANLIVSDIMGRVLDSYRLDSKKNSFVISMKKYNPGVYFYSLELNSRIMESKRMIVIQ